MFYDTYVRLCKEAGVSPSRAAEENGLSRTSVVKWRNGVTPNGGTIAKLAAYFGVPADVLLQGEGAPAQGEGRFQEEELIRLDADSMEILRAIRQRPDLKIMFSVSKNVTPEDLVKAIKIVEALKDESEQKEE